MGAPETPETTVERLVVGPLATNCYILKSGDELAVVDPGGDPGRILSKVEELGGTVKYVINTHGHIDHVAANQQILDAAGGELLIHEIDAEMLVDPDMNIGAMMGFQVEPMKASRTLRRDDIVEVGTEKLKVMHTPGHTPGSICLVGSTFTFTGDTLFVHSIGRTDFPGGSNTQMQASLLSLQASLPRDTMLYPGHDEPGPLGRAMLVNPFLGGGFAL